MSTPKKFRLKCPSCNTTIECDESILDMPKPVCADCGYPIQVERYPSLAKAIEEREKKAAADAEAQRQRLEEQRKEMAAQQQIERAKRQKEADEFREERERARIEARAARQFKANETRGQMAMMHKNVNKLPAARNPMLIGLIGCCLLTIGPFLPAIKDPIVGEITYFYNGQGDGIIILIFTAAAALLIIFGKYERLWIIGLIALGTISWSIINLIRRINDAKAKFSAEMTHNPFKELGEAQLEGIQLTIAWPVLAIGAVMLIAACYTAHCVAKINHSSR